MPHTQLPGMPHLIPDDRPIFRFWQSGWSGKKRCQWNEFLTNNRIPMHSSKTSLPELDGATLDYIFERVYDGYFMENTERDPSEEEKVLSDFFEVLKALQMFNYQHRTADAMQVYKITRRVFEVDLTSNSEGGILWLTLLLALKQLYGMSDRELLQCARKITVRK